MRIVSFNINGLRAILNKGFDQSVDYLNPDILSLNETKLNEDINKDYFPYEKLGYQIYWTNSKERKGYSGVAILSRIKPKSIHYGLIDGKYDNEGRSITLEFDNFYYVASYVPNAGEGLKRLDFRMNYEKDLIDYFKTLNKPIIYAGDLNVAHNPIDLANPKSNEHNPGYTIEERTAFSNLLDQGYIDTFRYLYPNTIKYSWWSYRMNARAKNVGWRIDYFIVSKSIIDKVKLTQIHNEIEGSDHCPISLDIDI